ncbi:MAG: NTP transferase domain-containing protein, partial [Alphaproteobacteria bacterium]|nr:NTP transferase domain-containing protein [Alphaproteobacteria bacterium]
MEFGEIETGSALGAILAHSVRAPGLTLPKGRRLGAEDIAALAAAGIARVWAARLAAGETGEDEAAARLGAALAGPGLRASRAATGRVNLHAETAGLLAVEAARVDALNAIDEAMTLATLPPGAILTAGQMAATVKIIPFGVRDDRLEAALSRLGDRPPLRLAPFRPARAGLVLTRVPGLKPGLLAKARETTAARLAAMGGTLAAERICPHAVGALAGALQDLCAEGCELLLVLGGSATLDRADVVPAAIRAAGGTVERLGMPVDPGNLLVLGSLGGRRVIGLPGCARSPQLNGVDLILARHLAGERLDGAVIAGLGVGGLLDETVHRPLARRIRETAQRQPRVAAIVLAAGASRRMGAMDKRLAVLAGKPLLRHAVEG